MTSTAPTLGKITRTNGVAGEYSYGVAVFWGRAPHDVVHAIRAARAAHDAPLFVVLSYGTPIAWAGPGEELIVPDVRYSVTTSRHQGIARRADGDAIVPAYRHKGSRQTS